MKRQILALIGIALATSVAAAVPQYSQLRQDNPEIDTAIAAATESDLHGTFNRLSALYNRAPINSLGVDAGTNGELPANFLRNLEATLIDLQEDLGKDQIGALSVDEKLTILQVVRTYAFRRTLELWQSEVITTCTGFCPVGTDPENPPPCPPCVDDDPAVINEVQDVVAASRSIYRDVYLSVPIADRGTLTAPNSLTAENYIGSIGTLLTIKGVESIDD